MSAPSVQLDLSKVKIEPLFEEFVDFDTFAKSDFRVVKVKECEAVTKTKKLLKFVLNDGTGIGPHHFKRYSRVLRAGRAGWQDLRGYHKPAAETDDGYSV